MADKCMYIPNDDTHNYPFCRLKLRDWNTHLNKPTDHNSASPKSCKLKANEKENVIIKLWGIV